VGEGNGRREIVKGGGGDRVVDWKKGVRQDDGTEVGKGKR
jgi:hypothetical protein